VASKFGKLIWRTFRGAFRLFLAHPAAIMSTILAAIALGLGYRLWRVGLRDGLSSLLGLAVCLLLIIVIPLARGKIRQWTQRRASERTAEVGKHIAKQAVREGAELAEDLLERGAETAKGALGTLADEVKGDWERHVAPPGADPSSPRAARCSSCGSFLRSGAKFCDKCGEPLPVTCPHCHRTSRPGAKFCDHCGAGLTSDQKA